MCSSATTKTRHVMLDFDMASEISPMDVDMTDNSRKRTNGI